MHGVPFDVAASLEDIERAAYCIIVSEHNGAKFNWHSFQFEEKS